MSATVDSAVSSGRIRSRPQPNFTLHSLATVELQLCLQWLDTDSRLAAARCSRRMLQAASAPFAWRAAPPFIVEVESPADVQCVCSSLLRFAPVHLCCARMASLQCVTTVPHLVGLELINAPASSATDLPQLLQHPDMARLETMRLDEDASMLLTVDTMRLIARLPQLHTFDMFVPEGDAGDAALMQPLAGAPALTDLTLHQKYWQTAGAALVSAISGFAALRRLSLNRLQISSGLFAGLCSSPNMRRLEHLGLVDYCARAEPIHGVDLPDANEYRAALNALEQLQTLTLHRVWSIDSLLAHLHHAPALRLLSIRCHPDDIGIGGPRSLLPSRPALSALLTAAPNPQLEVRLLVPSDVERWLDLNPAALESERFHYEQQWRELQLMGAEMDRVTVVDEAPAFV